MFIVALIMIILNWCLKLLVGWCVYSISIWFGWPEWVMLTVMIASVASTSN